MAWHYVGEAKKITLSTSDQQDHFQKGPCKRKRVTSQNWWDRKNNAHLQESVPECCLSVQTSGDLNQGTFYCDLAKNYCLTAAPGSMNLMKNNSTMDLFKGLLRRRCPFRQRIRRGFDPRPRICSGRPRRPPSCPGNRGYSGATVSEVEGAAPHLLPDLPGLFSARLGKVSWL